MAQCTGYLESHGRRRRCTRRAAKKYGDLLCGYCAAMHPKQCRVQAMATGETKAYHSPLCFTGQAACPLPQTTIR